MISKGVSVLTSFILFLCFGSVLTAQTGAESALIVNVGNEVEFESITKMSLSGISESADQEIAMQSMEALKVDSINLDRIFWTMTTIANVEISGDNNQMEQPAGVIPVVQQMITDKDGRLIEMSSSDAVMGADQSAFFGFGSGKAGQAMKGPGWFLPKKVFEVEVGEHWEVYVTDTMQIERSGIELDMGLELTVNYTFEGIVDTLGVQAARIRWSFDDMTTTASFDVPRSDIIVHLNGSGFASGVNYYSMTDNMLLQHATEMELVQTLDMGEMGTKEMVIFMDIEQTRVE